MLRRQMTEIAEDRRELVACGCKGVYDMDKHYRGPRLRRLIAGLAVLAGLFALPLSAPSVAHAATVTVSSEAELRAAVTDAGSGDIVVLAPGSYTLGSSLQINQGITLQSASGSPGDTIIEAAETSVDGVISIGSISAPGYDVTLRGLTVRNGKSSGSTGQGLGGGIAYFTQSGGNLTIDRCILDNNVARDAGGAICVVTTQSYQTPCVVITDTTISHNNTLEDSTVQGNGGGGICLAGGTGIINLTVRNSTLSGNTCGCSSIARGGGAILSSSGANNITIVNSTISGNTSGTTTGIGYGGGICLSSGDTLTIVNTTITGNSSPLPTGPDYTIGLGGGIFLASGTTATIENTIVSGNTGGDISGHYTGDHNLVNEDTTGWLGSLADNGGGTFTHALIDNGSNPATDAGSNDYITSALFGDPAYDQRGSDYARLTGGVVDIGAYELQYTTNTTLTASPASAAYGSPVTFTATVSGSAGTPCGTVTFWDGDTQLGGAISLSGGTATLQTASLAAGVHHLTTKYSGDSNFLASDSPTCDLTVQPANGSLSVSASSAAYASVIELGATLSPAASGRTISFRVNGVSVGSAQTDASGLASLAYTVDLLPSPDDYAIVASFAGDLDIAAAADATSSLSVSKAPTTLTASSPTGAYLSTVSLQATLSPHASGRSVHFQVNGVDVTTGVGGVILTGITDANGVASIPYRVTNQVGTYDVTAYFDGDDYLDASDTTANLPAATLTVTKATATLSVGSAGGDPGSTISLAATLSPAEAGHVIQFQLGAVALPEWTATTDANGVAKLSYAIPVGMDSLSVDINAQWAGNGNIAGVTFGSSTPGILTVNDVPPVFNPATYDPESVTGAVYEGATITPFTVSATDSNGDTVTFSSVTDSVYGLPPGLSIDTDFDPIAERSTGVISGTVDGHAADGAGPEGKTYHVKILATSSFTDWEGKTTTQSTPTTFDWTILPDTVAPTWPADAALTISGCTETGLTLSWPAATDDVKMVGYVVKVNGSEISPVLSAHDTTYVLTGLTKNTCYTVAMTAMDLAGNCSHLSASAWTLLGAPVAAWTTTGAKAPYLRVGDTFTFSFAGQTGVSATYTIGYEKSSDGSSWTAATASGSFAPNGSPPVYSATIAVPADAGFWRNLTLSVSASDGTNTWTTPAQALPYLIDTVAPEITDSSVTTHGPLRGGQSFTALVRTEAGIQPQMTLTTLDASGHEVPGTAVTYQMTADPLDSQEYGYTYTVGPAENRTVRVTAKAVDLAGNASTDIDLGSVVLDNTPPTLVSFDAVGASLIDGKAFYATGDTLTVRLKTTDTLASVGQVTFADGSFLPPLNLTQSPTDLTVYEGTYTIQSGDTTNGAAVSGAPAGTVLAGVTLTDTAGNTKQFAGATPIWVDTTPPDATGLSIAPLTTYSTTTLSYTLTRPARVLIEQQLDGGAWAAVYDSGAQYLVAGRQSRQVTLGSAGTYSFRITLKRAVTIPFTEQVVRTNPPAPQFEPPTTSVSGDTATTTTAADAAVDSSGNATAFVSQEQISAALSQAAANEGEGTKAVVEIRVVAPDDADSVGTIISGPALDQIAGSGVGAFTVSTPVASVTFDSQALSTISTEAGGNVNVTVARVDAGTLSDAARQLVGDRPVFEFSVTSGNTTIAQLGGTAEVTLPYALKPGEDPNAVVIYYIDADGRPQVVSNCSYDQQTGTVRFTTSHFSRYAVGHNEVSFSDVTAGDWYAGAVDFVAARGITTGTGDNLFSPDATLTRGQFLVMVMRAYGIAPDSSPQDNFADAGNDYYTGYLATAKRLGIASGVGNDCYAPDQAITRQEMCVLLHNALKILGRLPDAKVANQLMDYPDAAEVASWAKDAMTLFVQAGAIHGDAGLLAPADVTSRAQMAQTLYNLMTK